MVFTLLIAADLHGSKTNYEVEFPSQPTVPDLHRRVEAIFGPEHAARAPPGSPTTFTIDRIQIFDERVELWVDLLSSTQLQDFSQIYVFQPETAWHKEVQSKLPPAIRLPAASFAAPPAIATIDRSPSLAASAAAAAAAAAAATPVAVIPAVAPAAAVVAAPSPATVAAAAAAAAAVSVPFSRAAHEASHEEKVAMVYDEMDSRKIRAVDVGEFTAFMTTLQFEMSSLAIGDLFQKADANHDGTISFPEFQRFCERYPTLLDAMHYRAKEYWADVKQKEGIEASRRLLDSLRAREIDARSASTQAAHESAAQEGRVAAQIQVVSEAEAKERDALALLEASRLETERARGDVAARCADEAGARDAERMRQLQHLESQRDVEQTEARLRVQEAEQAHAEERLREIERLLMEQQREVEAQRQNSIRVRNDLANVAAVEKQAALISAEATRELSLAAERLALSKTELGRVQDREGEAAAGHIAARDGTVAQRLQKEREDQELLLSREREAAKRSVEAEATRAVETQDVLCKGLEQENIEHHASRIKVQAEEAPLIDQEIRLREQRDNLEQREAQLRDEAGAFTARTGATRGVTSPRSQVAPAPSPATIAAAQVAYSAAKASPIHATPDRVRSNSPNRYRSPMSAAQ